MKDVQALHKKYEGKAVAVIGVNALERGGNPAQTMKQMGCTYELVLQGDEVARKYGVSGIPAFFLIGPDGSVLMSFAGHRPAEFRRVDEMIDEALRGLEAEEAGKSGR